MILKILKIEDGMFGKEPASQLKKEQTNKLNYSSPVRTHSIPSFPFLIQTRK